jgi:hypothetical protein
MVSKEFTPFDAYVTYLSFKLHFSNSNYNFFKFNGKTKANVNSFKTRKDKYYFDKISTKITRESFIERMLVLQDNYQNWWIKDIFSEESKNLYFKWRGYIEAFEYSFMKDVSKIKEESLLSNTKISDVFFVQSGNTHPKIFKMMISKEIFNETFITLDIMTNFLRSSKTPNDIVWKDSIKYLSKYYPFISKYIPEKERLAVLFNKTFCAESLVCEK